MSWCTSKTTTCLTLLSCALLGGYASIFTTWQHGFLDALRVCTAKPTSMSPEEEHCRLDMSSSEPILETAHATVPAVDSVIKILLELFAQGLRKQNAAAGIDLESLLAFSYLAVNFGGAWFLLALEGLRRGNANTVLSWTGTFGIGIQTATIAVVAPVYLALQLLMAPDSPQSEELLVDPTDLAVLPASAAISFLLPTIGLSLPLLDVLSQKGKYLAIAIWQPFPLYQTAVHFILRLLFGGQSLARSGTATTRTNPQRYRDLFARYYTFALCLPMLLHWVVIGTSLLSKVSAVRILALTSLTNPPTLALLDESPVSATSSGRIVEAFLRWDVYCACASLAFWSFHHLRLVQRSSSGGAATLTLVAKGAVWTILGGPIAPAVVFLWERDHEILRRLEVSVITGKKR